MIASIRHCRALVFSALLLALTLPGAMAAAPPDFASIVEARGPAVVNISSLQAPEPSPLTALPGMGESEEWLELLRRVFPQVPDLPELVGPELEEPSLGSGFIVSPDGYILTNAHVVANADEIVVRLSDRREFNAVVVGADPRSDVAVIRIEAEDLPVVRFGEPDELKVGEWVLAIGSPFGFDHTVTAGIVSGKGRALPDENFVPFIQTDVAINPGNSGGPLFNLKGEVVGINSQIYSETGGFMGLSFAIPIDVAMDVHDQLRSEGRVRRGRIGVAVQEVTRALAESFGLDEAEGALVGSVELNGPAAQAGILPGDVIVRFAGKPVVSSTSLPRIVSAQRPDSETKVTVVRDGRKIELKLRVGEWSDEKPEVAPASKMPEPNRLGLVLSRPDEASRRELGIEHGLIVDAVSGAAARAGVLTGDVILALVADGKRTDLDSVKRFERLVSKLSKGEAVTLLVQRGATTSFLSLRVGQEGPE